MVMPACRVTLGGRAGPRRPGLPLRRSLSKRLTETSLAAAAKLKESKRARATAKVYSFLAHDATQMALYILMIVLFQLIGNNLRNSSEYFTTKYITDVLLEAPFTEGNPDDMFMGIGEISDIYDWGDNVLWPGLLKTTYPRNPIDESDEPVHYTPAELAGYMDRFDWTAGVSFVQLRVAAADDREKCGSSQYARVSKMVGLIEQFGTADENGEGVDLSKLEPVSVKTRHYHCLPDLSFAGESGTGSIDTAPFGYNYTHPGEPLTHPFLYWTSDELGSNGAGQVSASAEIEFASIPTDGHAQFVIPFFSDVWLPEERGLWDQVTDYRLYAYNVSMRPTYYCVRMSFNGQHIRQVCDPNDAEGRTTGVVPAAVLEFWNDMKRAHYIDPQTRSILVTMPLRNNNAGVRFRLSMLFHVTSTGGIVPSYDIESRPDAIDSAEMQGLFVATFVMTLYFAAMEVHELFQYGFFGYFGNMWNLMDWTNFALYGVLYMSFQDTREALNTYYCSEICNRVGFHDPWQVTAANTSTKQVIAIITTIQWIKVIKFVNMFVPKFSLATSVLSHALVDLLLFGIVFVWSIAAFAQLFYMQLGPYMRVYASQTMAITTLSRALFGDFDIEAVIDSSSSMMNMLMFLSYLFFAVFILLSIFLTILADHQEYVREEARESGDVDEWGVIGKAKAWIIENAKKLAKAKSKDRTDIKDGKGDKDGKDGTDATAAAAPAAGDESAVEKLKDLAEDFAEGIVHGIGRLLFGEEADEESGRDRASSTGRDRASSTGQRVGTTGSLPPIDPEALASLQRDMAAIKAIVKKRSEILKLLVQKGRHRRRSQRVASKAVSVFAELASRKASKRAGGSHATESLPQPESLNRSGSSGRFLASCVEGGGSPKPDSFERSGSSGRFLSSCGDSLSDNEAGALEDAEARVARRRGGSKSPVNGTPVSDGEDSTASRRRIRRRRSSPELTPGGMRSPAESEISEKRLRKRRSVSPTEGAGEGHARSRRHGSSPVLTTTSQGAGPSRAALSAV